MILFQDIISDFREFPGVIPESYTNGDNSQMQEKSTDVRCCMKNSYSYVLGLSLYFLLLSFQ